MLRQWRYAMLVGLAVAVTLFISACGGTTTGSGGGNTSAPGTLGTPGNYTCISGSLVASGSTALAPLVQKVARAYQGRCSGAHITVNLGGSKTGLSQVEAGSVGIGDSDVFADKTTQGDLVDHQVAVVIFAVIINSKVGVTKLTTDRIKGIYAGTITNWKQVGGPDMKIVVVSRPASSGTRATFQQYILGGPEKITGPSSLVSDSTGTVATEVKQTAGAIGYITLGSAQSLSLTPLSIDGNSPTNTSLVESNTYKFWNIEHMYTKGPASGLTQAFIDYMFSSTAKQEEAKLAFLSTTQMSASALQAHQPTS